MSATPNTAWLEGCVPLDEQGFIFTGSILTYEQLKKAGWPLPLESRLLEMSIPGVFAIPILRKLRRFVSHAALRIRFRLIENPNLGPIWVK